MNYLGGDMPTFALNFSRSGTQIVAQYYNFLRLGFEGTGACSRRTRQRDVPRRGDRQARSVRAHHRRQRAARVRVPLKEGTGNYTVFDVSDGLRDRGWLVPAYSFPENRQDLAVLRIVVKNGIRATSPTCCSTTCAATSATSSSSPRRCPRPTPAASTTDIRDECGVASPACAGKSRRTVGVRVVRDAERPGHRAPAVHRVAFGPPGGGPSYQVCIDRSQKYSLCSCSTPRG